MSEVSKLAVKCGKCTHQAASHSPKDKHGCKVFGCDCQWFKMPEENE
jgi:hypothetical protein